MPYVSLPYITKEGAGGPPQPGFFGGYAREVARSAVRAERSECVRTSRFPNSRCRRAWIRSRLADRRTAGGTTRPHVGRREVRGRSSGDDGFQQRAFDLLDFDRHAAGVSAVARTRKAVAERLRPQHLRPKRAAGPPADRSRHAGGHHLLGPRRQRHLGHARQQLQHGCKANCCRSSTRRCRACSTIWSTAACSTGRWSS